MYILVNGKRYEIPRGCMENADVYTPNWQNKTTKEMKTLEICPSIQKHHLYPEDAPIYIFEGEISKEDIKSLQEDPYQIVQANNNIWENPYQLLKPTGEIKMSKKDLTEKKPLSYPKVQELASKLELYASYEDTELGEACSLLTRLSSRLDYVSDEFEQAVIKEMQAQLENFEEWSEIVQETKISTYTTTELHWKE
jgi:hypothetical protein